LEWKCKNVSLQVHESQVIGEVGKGYKYAIETLNTGRIGIGAQVSVFMCVYACVEVSKR